MKKSGRWAFPELGFSHPGDQHVSRFGWTGGSGWIVLDSGGFQIFIPENLLQVVENVSEQHLGVRRGIALADAHG
ncbi:hypothetical protein MHYP_G00107570 [Metynnis hypsauchen]